MSSSAAFSLNSGRVGQDPNLANVRDDPEFIALLSELRAQWERYRKTL